MFFNIASFTNATKTISPNRVNGTTLPSARKWKLKSISKIWGMREYCSDNIVMNDLVDVAELGSNGLELPA